MNTQSVFGRIVGAEARVAREEAREGTVHIGALCLTKIADGLIDPKLVLAWVMTAVGAPGSLIGALVPVREAGALLPQLGLARMVEARRTRKLFWSAGSAIQGVSAVAIALAAVTLEGASAGLAILAALALLSFARAVCSVTYKDALADSVETTRRGAVTGLAASVASTAVLGFGVLLALGVIPLTVPAMAAAVALAGLFWIVAAGLFLRLDEADREPVSRPAEGLAALLSPLRSDRQLRLFILTRALLTATALATPFLVMLGAERAAAGGIGELGPMVLASATASILSAYIWGRLSDRSSRLTLAAAGGLGAVSLGAAAALGATTGGLGGLAGTVAAVFFVQIAYEGVRSGRKIHLTDMAPDDTRARYTAVSNSIIGLVLLVGGGLGLVADLAGASAALAGLALLCALAVPAALALEDVQR